MEEKKKSAPNPEIKEEKKSSEVFKTALKISIGFIMVLLGLVALINWWGALAIVFKGCIGLILILAGAITIAIAKE
jgi:uncharacterized membrane protein YkgB